MFKDIMEWIKSARFLLSMVSMVVALIVAVTIFAADVKQMKADVADLKQIAAQNAAIKLELARTQGKLLDMFMKFYELDPDRVSGWKQVPPEPRLDSLGDTVAYQPWCRVIGFDSIIMYEIRRDSIGQPSLWRSVLFPDPVDSL